MKQLDTIYINDLQLPCLIGAFEQERHSKQMIIINVELSVDLTKPAITDNIQDTVNYSNIASQIVDVVEKSKFYLLEGLAGAIAKTCLQNKRIKQVKVHIEKPKAIKLGRSSAVAIIRSHAE